MKSRKIHRWPVAASLAILLLASLAVSPAQAGPDDGKPIATQTHIDGPKAFWENNNFVLKTEGKFGGMPTSAKPMQDVIHWVGQGYSERWKGESEQQFMYTVPEQGGAALAFLGAPGDTWYQAPRLPVGNHNPIWIGMGADSGLPVDSFRDGTASIDLLSVDGPGQVEWLQTTLEDERWDVIRYLSSADPNRRSHKITAGSHAHMDTLFSKPGRYTLTYQASARLHDGTLVRSEPQEQVWQVGGNQPATSVSQPLAEQYNRSAHGRPATPYELTYSSAEGSVSDSRMDGKLTDISFSAAPNVSGTLTVFVDGYFHSEVPVTGGKAMAREFMGTKESSVQGVFVPSDGGTAETPAYVLAPVKYQHGKTTILTSRQPAGAMPVPSHEESPTVAFERHAPAALGYTATIKPLGDDLYQAELQFDDPEIRAFMGGGVYESVTDRYAEIEFAGWSGLQNMSDVFSWDERYFGKDLKILASPHPSTSIRTLAVELPGVLPTTTPIVVHGEVEADTITLEPQPTSTPTTIAPTPSIPTGPAEVCPRQDDRVQLSQGHVDLKAELESDAGLDMVLADETAQIDKYTVDRDPDQVALVVTNAARSIRLPAHSGTEFDFLGPVGSRFYRLPQTQQPNIIWPGWNTMGIDYSKLDGGIELQLRGLQAPQGGHVKVFTTDVLGKPTLLMDSAGPNNSIDISYSTHTHAEWIFTQAGTYDLTLAFAANSKDGSSLDSREHTLRVVVDQPATEPCTKTDATTPPPPTHTPMTDEGEKTPDSEGTTGNTDVTGKESPGKPLAGITAEDTSTNALHGDSPGAKDLAATGAISTVYSLGALMLVLAGGMLILFRRRTH